MTKLYVLSTFHPAVGEALDERDMCLDAQTVFLSPERAKADAQSDADTWFYENVEEGDPAKLEWSFTASGPAKREAFPHGLTGKVWEARDAASQTEYRVTEVIAG